MGIDFNPCLNVHGLNLNVRSQIASPAFASQTPPDKFESQNPARFTNEAVLTKLINANPKIISILQSVNAPCKLNMKDLETLLQNHCTDVQKIALGISENLPFSLKAKVNEKAVSDAAYLHDIGKVLIPPEILNKNAKLDETETKIMHKHSELGYELLKNTNLDKTTLNLIRNHHQNAKKNGYPFVNNDFRADLNLQILTMADKYSALTEKRSYKDAFTPQEALTIIYQDVKDGKLHPFIFKALVNYANSRQPVEAA